MNKQFMVKYQKEQGGNGTVVTTQVSAASVTEEKSITEETIKSELSKISWKNLYVNSGADAEYFEKIAEAVGIANVNDILAFADVGGITRTGSRGIAITSNGIKWKNIAEEPAFDKEESKDIFWKSGELSFKRLGSYKFGVETEKGYFCVNLTNQDIRIEENLHQGFVFKYDDARNESEIQEELLAVKHFFELLLSLEPCGEIPDEVSTEMVDAFIIGTKDSCKWYREAFASYTKKGGSFAFLFSGAGFLFGVINLIHRKLYIPAILWFLLCCVVVAILGNNNLGIIQIAISIVAAFVNPYLVYRRFRKILLDCHNQHMSREQILENLKLRGGPNAFTNAIYDSKAFKVLKILFFIGIAIEAISWIISLFH